MTTNNIDPARQKLILPVAFVVALGWLSSLGYAVFTNRFEALTVTTPVMLLLAGYAFGVSITRKGG